MKPGNIPNTIGFLINHAYDKHDKHIFVYFVWTSMRSRVWLVMIRIKNKPDTNPDSTKINNPDPYPI